MKTALQEYAQEKFCQSMPKSIFHNPLLLLFSLDFLVYVLSNEIRYRSLPELSP